jgi:hypothetical protein
MSSPRGLLLWGIVRLDIADAETTKATPDRSGVAFSL